MINLLYISATTPASAVTAAQNAVAANVGVAVTSTNKTLTAVDFRTSGSGLPIEVNQGEYGLQSIPGVYV